MSKVATVWTRNSERGLEQMSADWAVIDVRSGKPALLGDLKPGDTFKHRVQDERVGEVLPVERVTVTLEVESFGVPSVADLIESVLTGGQHARYGLPPSVRVKVRR